MISAQGKVGNKLKDVRREERDPNVLDLTDKNGEAEFVIDACTNCDPITITVWMNIIVSNSTSSFHLP